VPVCKTVGIAYVGSNPTPATTSTNTSKPASDQHICARGRLDPVSSDVQPCPVAIECSRYMRAGAWRAQSPGRLWVVRHDTVVRVGAYGAQHRVLWRLEDRTLGVGRHEYPLVDGVQIGLRRARRPECGPFQGLADWYRRAGSEARAARDSINTMYAAFPDRDNVVLSRLRGDDDVGVLQATDELCVHHLLSQSCEPKYEEDDTTGKRPDFRLYRSSEYLAAAEVLTLFTEEDFASEVDRSDKLVGEINARVRPTKWHVGLRVVEWRRQPRVSHLARWIEDTIAGLPEPVAGLAREDYPTARYATPEVELAFTFFPRHRTTELMASGPIVMFGPAVAHLVKPAERLRVALSRKSGSRYDTRGRPFAVIASVRDTGCNTEDIVNALYRDEVVVFDSNDLSSSRPSRKRNGFFGITSDAPNGRNRRTSCVFALLRGWAPGSDTVPAVIRLDNPFAELEFPDELLVADHRFVARRSDTQVRMEWEHSDAERRRI